jgi:hypothetical protein
VSQEPTPPPYTAPAAPAVEPAPRTRLVVVEEDSGDDEDGTPVVLPSAKTEPPTPSQQRMRLPITEEDSDDAEDAPPAPPPPPNRTASEEKDLGNHLFREGDTAGALAAYSRSLALDGSSAAVYSNRAAVHLKVRSAPSSVPLCVGLQFC